MRSLLMGGQACVFYGAAEFSRDLDLIILLDEENLQHLRLALDELHAEPIAVPDLNGDFLARGHAVHFRCRLPGLDELRIYLMSNLRGVPPFELLWQRRVTIEAEGQLIDLLSLPDLVLAKKTQRDKDWPMIRRLVDQHYFSTPDSTPADITFWLAESRTPEILLEVVSRYPALSADCQRQAAKAATSRNYAAIESALGSEQKLERAADRLYWEPLRKELEQLRLLRRSSSPTVPH